MNLHRTGLLSLAGAAVLSAGLALPAQAQEVSDVYRPFDCSLEDETCVDVGDSRLLRSESGLVANVVTSRLKKGHAHSLWWVIFGNPEECIDGCDASDLEIEAVNGAVIWATGGVVGDFGTGNRATGHFAAVLNQSEMPEESSPETAEVHIVIRSKSRASANNAGEQMTSFEGGCETDITPDIPKKKGECANVQFTIHTAPEAEAE